MSSLTDTLMLLPKPALSCIVDAVTKTTCGADVACICANEELNNEATSCIQANCTIRESLTAQNLTNTLCGRESVPDHAYLNILMPFMALACVTVILRFVARHMKGAKYWWDDACNLVALICCVAFSVLSITMRDLGMGYDIWAVPQEKLSPLLMNYWVNFIMYATSRLFIRLSIVLFFLRIFSLASARKVMIFTAVLVVCSSTAYIFTILFLCTPVNYFWLRWDNEHKGTCVNLSLFMRVSAILSIVIDVWQLLVAVPFVLRLKLSLKKRLFIVVMFTVGIAVIILSIIRYPTITRFTNSLNASREIIHVGFWSALELDVGVICACLPSLQVLLKSCFQKREKGSSSGFVELSPTNQKAGYGSAESKSKNSSLPSSRGRMLRAIREQTWTDSTLNLSVDAETVREVEVEMDLTNKNSWQTTRAEGHG